MADQSDCRMAAALQSALRHSACSPQDPAAERENSQSHSTPSRHVQDQSSYTDSEAKNVFSVKQNVYTYLNLLRHAFEQCRSNRFWTTEIAYISTPQGMLYTYAILELYGRMAHAYRIGSDMAASLVTLTIQDTLNAEKGTLGLALHSDQRS